MTQLSDGSYRINKLTAGDGVYFFNEHGVRLDAGERYRVTIKLSSLDATAKGMLYVNFPGCDKRKPHQYTAPFEGKVGSLEFDAQEGDCVRANCIIRGDGEAVVESVDVTRLPRANAASGVETPARNLLGQGSGFEVGMHGMNAFHVESWWFGWIDPPSQPVFDSTVAYDGMYSLRLTAQNYSNVFMHETSNCVWFSPIKLERGKTYTLSAYMKSDRAGMQAYLSNAEYDGKSQRFTVGTQWKRYSFTFKVDYGRWKEGYCRSWVGIDRNMTAGNLWIDNVQLEEGECVSDYKCEPMEFGAVLEMQPDKLLRKSLLGGYYITARFRNNTANDEFAQVNYVIKDYWDNECASGTLDATVPAQGNAVRLLTIPELPCGYYRAYFTSPDDKLYDEVIFGIYEPMKYTGKLPLDWPLGCHDCAALPILRDLGFGWIRDFHCYSMKKVVPNEGKFVFHNTDVNIAKAEAANLNVMPILGPEFFCDDSYTAAVPKWAVDDKIISSEVSRRKDLAFPRMDVWRKYVYELAKRYKGRIKAWEVLNEPDGWGLKPELYQQYMQAAYEEAKKADPDCMIIAGSTTSDFGLIPLPWTRAIMDTDGYKHFDAISIHMYSTTMPERTLGGAENFLKLIRDGLIQHGRDIPVWHTEKSHTVKELGYGKRKFALPNTYEGSPGYVVDTFRQRAEYLLRENIIDSTVGKGPFFWFAECTSAQYIAQKVMSGYDPYWLWHTEYDGSPMPELLAANGLARMLDGPAKPIELVKLSDSVYCGLYENGECAIAALWNIRGKTTLAMPEDADGVTSYNFFGEPFAEQKRIVTIDTAPIYLRANGLNAAALKEMLNRAKLDASSVHIFGELEKSADEGLVLAVYADNGGVAGQKISVKVTNIPDGWKLSTTTWDGVSKKSTPPRAVFPVANIGNTDAQSVFTVVFNDGEAREIAIPRFISADSFTIPPAVSALAAHVTKPRVIDGKLGEWSATPSACSAYHEQVKFGKDKWKHTADLAAFAYFAWDDTNLYAAFRIIDDKVVRFAAPGSSWQSDGVELFLGLDPDAPRHQSAETSRMGDTDFQIFLAPGTPDGKYHSATAAIAGRNGTPNITIASSLTDDGYLLEAAIPWRELKADFKPVAGKKIMMGFQCTDTDEPGVSTSKKTYWTGDESNYNSPLNWGKLELMR